MGYKMPMFVSKIFNENDIHAIKTKIIDTLLYLSNDIDLFKTDWITKTEVFIGSDIVHIHNIHGWFFNLNTLKKISDLKPTIWTLHDMWAITPHCAHSFGGKLKNGFYECPNLKSYPRILWNNARYLAWRKKNIYKNLNIELVVPSLWLKEKVSKSILGNKKIHLIHNGIDTNTYKMSLEKNKGELNLP